MAPIEQLDAYSLLLIFYHINDIRTLFGSCSIVCKNWYRTFFAITEENVKWRKNLQPLYNSSFCQTFNKIVYLNRMVEVLDLENQYGEWMGTRKCFNIYQQLEMEINDSNLFGNILKYKKREGGKLKKRYMTLSVYCPLVASIRNPRMAIRNLSKVNSIPTMFEDGERFITSVCQYLVAVTDKKVDNGSVSFYSSLDNECLLKDFKIEDNVQIINMTLTFHPFMNTENRKVMNIDPKQPDANIYCLYILYKKSNLKQLMKYLVCDNLQGELLVKEQYQILKDSQFPDSDCVPSLTVSGWEHYGMDLVIVTTLNCLYLCIPNHGVIYHMFKTPFPAYNTTPLIGASLNVECNIQSSYLINFTKVLQNKGFTLSETNKYSNYSVFSLQFGGEVYDNLLQTHTIYLVIAQKKEPVTEGEYSVFWRLCPQLSKSIDVTCYDYDYMEMREHTQKILCYLNQGKELISEISHYVVNYSWKSTDDFYERHWERNLARYMKYYNFETIRKRHEIWERQEY